ncbi:hypothetical protein [Streptomyces sp. NPDC000618]|uniref:hypothetical protein n=1 Tax=Streptomyces sp. NPDC000618 TaxID=3154265 RepID=UPI00331FB0AF
MEADVMAEWQGWETAGGKTFSPPAVTARGNGLHLFIRDENNRVMRRRYDGSSWDPWKEMPGGQLTYSGPAATTREDDALYVFTRDADGSMSWNRHPAKNATKWDGWDSVPIGKTPSEPATTWYPTGGATNVILSVRGTDDRLHWISILGETWGEWNRVGDGVTYSSPGIAWLPGGIFEDPRMHLVVRGTDDGLHHIVYTGDDWGEGWHEIPGGGKTFSAPALTYFNGSTFEAEKVHLAVRGTDDRLHHNSCDGDDADSWEGWSQVPGGMTFDAPALTEYDEDLYLFVRGTDDAIHYNRFN